MKVPLKLLKEFVHLKETPEELAKIFTMHSMPVENIIGGKAAVKNVVVGFIKTMIKHPNADKLQICKMDVGQKEPIQVLTAATNDHQGLKVPVALVGAELAGGFQIKEAVMRGEKSFGMLCSEKELGLADESAGILILPHTAPVGKNIVEYLGLDDIVLDIEVLPNRPDCLSVLGVAREFGAILKRPLKEPRIETLKKQSTSKNRTAVNVKDHVACPRYMAVLLENVKIAPSPDWLQRHLKAAGVRPISNVVDVTNYILMEMGQPLHAFSFDKLEGGQINVRFAKDKEELLTLDGKARVLDKNTLVIADRNKPQALAGIMGGAGSEVTEETRTVLLESAYFQPVLIRKTAKRYGLHTEASLRFSRGVDWNGVHNALCRAVKLIQETAGGEVVSEIFDKKQDDPKQVKISLRLERASQVLGYKVSEAEVVEILKDLGFSLKSLGDRVDVLVPSWRTGDITRDIDLIEELARIIGYDKIPVTLPKKQVPPQVSSKLDKTLAAVKTALIVSGLSEIFTYSFTSPVLYKKFGLSDEQVPKSLLEYVTIQNPLSPEMSVLRNSILPELIAVLERNWYRQTYDIKVFETGTVFSETAGSAERPTKVPAFPKEHKKVAGLICGEFLDRPWTGIKANDMDFYCLKGIIENIFSALGASLPQLSRSTHPFLHPGKSAEIAGVGVFGELHPVILRKLDINKKAYAFELDLDALSEIADFTRVQKPIPNLPYSRRDVAFIVPDTVSFEDVRAAILSLRSQLITELYLFDRYQGEQVKAGHISLAVALHYQSLEKTLTDQEVENEHRKVIKVLQEKLKAEVRS
jgi:phenylalanyl-tRNA synthetase beta chain